MRLDEICSLRREDLVRALQTGKLALSNTKGGRPREIPLSDEARYTFQRALVGVEKGAYVFNEGQNVQESENVVQKFIARHREAIQDSGAEKQQAEDSHVTSPSDLFPME